MLLYDLTSVERCHRQTSKLCRWCPQAALLTPRLLLAGAPPASSRRHQTLTAGLEAVALATVVGAALATGTASAEAASVTGTETGMETGAGVGSEGIKVLSFRCKPSKLWLYCECASLQAARRCYC